MNHTLASLNVKVRQAAQGREVAFLCLGTGTALLVLLFALWPYQHWQFAHRGSVLEGWVKVLGLHMNAEWQFCYVVPVITGFLVYRLRDTLARLPVKGSWWGAVVFGLAMISYWFGYKVDTGYLGFAALQLSVAGLILLLGGLEWMRVLFFPWLFLAFAWPFFPLDSLLAAKLKIPTAQIASQILTFIGVGVVREGSTLQSAADQAAGLVQGARFTLDVADSCSGMRSLYALVMVGVLYGYMSLKRTVPRLLLAASAIPLAVAGNVVRLLLLTMGSIWFGQEFAVGKSVGDRHVDSAFHLLAGFMVFGVALAGMFALATLFEGKHLNRIRFWSGGKEATGGHSDPLRVTAGKSLVAVLLALSGILLCWTTPTSVTLAEPGMRMALPASVSGFQSMPRSMTAKEQSLFDVGVKLDRRLYASPEGRQILGTIVVSGEMKKSLHQPEVCLPDQGWIISSTQEVPVPLGEGRYMNVTLMRLFRDYEPEPGRRMRMKALNLYWYQGSRGTSTPSYFMSNVISYRDALFRNLNHRWSMASYFMPLPQREIGVDMTNPLEEVEAMDLLMRFVGESAPQYILSS